MAARAVAAHRADAFSWRQFRVLLAVIRKGEKVTDASGMGMGNDAKAGRVMNAVARKVLVGALMLGLAALFFFLGWLAGTSGTRPFPIFATMLVALVVMTLFTGLYQAVNVLYFVRDLSYYLTLPLSPTVVMWAKLTHFLAQYLVSDLLFLPMGLGCLWGLGAPAGAYVSMTLAFALCALALNFALVIVVVPIMRFSKLAHNKDRFSRVFGALATVFCLAIGVGSQFLVRLGDGGAFVAGAAGLVSEGPASVVFALLCPPVLVARTAIEGGPAEVALALLAMAALVAVYAVLLSWCARRWYLEGARALQGAGGEKSTRRFAGSDLRRVAGARSALFANLERDWKTMARVPAFFNQFVLSSLLMPLYFLAIIAVVVFLQVQGDGMDVGLMLSLARELAGQMGFDSLALVVCALVLLGVVLFMGFSSYSFTMAVSRDGEDFFFLRAMPMDWTAYLVAKFVPTALIGTVPVLLLLVALMALVGLPAAPAGYLLVLYVAAAASADVLSLGIGARWPNLHWDNEAQLTRGGKAALIVYAGLIMAAVVMAVPALVVAAPIIWGVLAPAAALGLGLALQLAVLVGVSWWTFVAGARSLARREP